ncbi:hypothetical protein SDJN02_13818, partial [Cucurbita argyrosperma subsp. argyrosperma]
SRLPFLSSPPSLFDLLLLCIFNSSSLQIDSRSWIGDEIFFRAIHRVGSDMDSCSERFFPVNSRSNCVDGVVVLIFSLRWHYGYQGTVRSCVMENY